MDSGIMNQVYDVLKTMTIPQIKDALSRSNVTLSNEEYIMFKHQCEFAIAKKVAGKW